jgi:hypothetical protein
MGGLHVISFYAAGSRTTLMHPSCFSRNILYARGASLSGRRCVTTKLGIDLALADEVEQPRHVLVHVGLAGLDRQALVHQRAHGDLVRHAAVHAGDRDRAALAAAVDRLANDRRPLAFEHRHRLELVVGGLQGRGAVRFHADGVDADVRADAAGDLEQALVDALLAMVDRDRAGVAGHLQALGDH